MNLARHSPILLVTTMTFLLAGCVTHRAKTAQIGELVEDDTFTENGTVEAPELWWSAFGHDELSELVSRSLEGNLDIRQAWERLSQAQASYLRTRSGKLPSVNLTNERTYVDDLSNDDPTTKSSSMGLSLSYQVDLWGQIAADTRADSLTYQATRKDLEATALTLTGQVGLAWLDLIDQSQRLAVLTEQVSVNRDYLELVELRFAQGLASATEVYQQSQQLADIENRIPQTRANIEIAEHQLALLLGENPLSWSYSGDTQLPDMPALPQTGIPADVLAKRPDVKNAELRLFSADERLRSAKLDRYPRLDLTGSVASGDRDLTPSLDAWVLNLAGNLIQPLFDGGARKAEVARNRAAVEELFYAWKKTVYVAIAEVEDALVQEHALLESLAGTRKRVTLAERTLDSAHKNYVNGVVDYLTVLTSLQTLQNLQLEEVQAQRAALANRIELYLSLGGHWTEDLEKPFAVAQGK
ncbi:TolC family protein [Sulfidibacter corallicola]|uniref:TolC family protein n=1 Tax=Sulfidibacter corallicola TaxID=2818388 RepID=A0A8A4TEJ3_SULCO|nr:TolC family protein [Sulfidibacter corallicola]QTD47970.1 TolC family protein [Sulfidibacter corallicola]